jgi:membrane-bound lytic murein transglycosylase D
MNLRIYPIALLLLLFTLTANAKTSAIPTAAIALGTTSDDTSFVIPEVDLSQLNIAPKFELAVYKKRLDSLTKQIPLDYNEFVQGYINLYAFRKREQVERMLGLSEFYFPMVERVFKEYNIPTEFKYLAIVESALNPYAVSPVGATGMWQFMFTTGKMYNLKITSHIDERRDPLKATHAAAKYFVDMYKRYGDWLLVIAAYNCGPGNVNRAIRKSGGGKTFWEIRNYLPAETRGYVPAYIAATYIMNCAEVHNIYPTYPNFSFMTDTVQLAQPVAFKDIVKLCGISAEELKILNPIFKKDFVPAYNESFTIKIPATRKDILALNKDSLYRSFPNKTNVESMFVLNTDPLANSRTVYKTHVVRKGETLSKLSGKYDVSISEIKKWNKIKRNSLVAGQRLRIKREIKVAPSTTPIQLVAKNKATKTKEAPVTEQQQVVASTEAPIESTKQAEEVTVQNVIKKETYTVKPGDNLARIAAKYDVSLDDIKKWNDLNSSKILVGQKINIQATVQKVVSKNAKEQTEESTLTAKVPTRNSEEKLVLYKVEIGDTLWAIAKRFEGMTIEKLRELNGLKSNESLKAGMILKVIKKA